MSESAAGVPDPPLKKRKTTNEENFSKEATNNDVNMDTSNGTNKKSANGTANGNMTSEHKDNGNNKASEDIDESLYSRQLYVMGHQAMKKMATSRILISGLSGLGAEIAKNVILSGMKSVCLHDTVDTEFSDLSSHFFLSESDVGLNRAKACLEKMRNLNSYVEVTCSTSPNVIDIVKDYDVVVLVDSTYDLMLAVNEVTHANGIKLHCANVFGLFAILFNDFGEDFQIQDTNGEEPISTMISCVLEDGTVTCHDETRHGFEDGDYVTFSEVQGMDQLNSLEKVKIKVSGPYSFKIEVEGGLGDVEGKGGYATQVKVPKKMPFKPLKTSILSEEGSMTEMTDFSKMSRPKQLKLALMALSKFQEKEKRSPRPWNQEDAAKFVEVAKAVASENNKTLDEDDESVLNKFAKICRGKLSPISAAMGGLSAQEVIKACTGKFTPLEWMVFDAIECLPKDDLTEEQCQPLGNRYDGQVVVFGKDFQEKLSGHKNFVVGAGAIGCEVLKNYAMMGLGVGNGGMIFVTDMDVIEKSNLNRQFLFRSWDVGQMKSQTAAKAIKAMNGQVNVSPQDNRVCPETEAFYDDTYFENLDCITNALDNVEARTYMDRRCVYYRKPLLESGTLGTKGNTQVVIPNLTESYSSSQDPPEKSIPICTLKNFPNRIEHTLQWARDLFEGLFTQAPQTAKQALEESDFFKKTMSLPGSQPLDTLEQVKKILVEDRPNSYEDCVIWSRNLFENLFANQIKQLLHNFPKDQKTSTGQPFWSGPKRCPHPVEFSLENKYHLDFVAAGARLYAEVYNLKVPSDDSQLTKILSSFKPAEFKPQSGVKIAATDEEAEAMNNMGGSSDKKKVKELVKELEKCASKASMAINVHDFEKDDDSNGHMDFIVAASNLRAENYSIGQADRHKSKLIAGRIIPAIATTTSLVAGLVGLELYKLIQGHQDMGLYRNAFANLALPFVTMSEPIGAKKDKYYDTEWSLWDRFEIDEKEELTLEEFMAYFQNNHKLEISMISQGVSMLYSFFMNKDSRAERMKMKMSDIVESVSKRKIEPHVKSLVFEICCNDTEGEDVDVPYVKYNLPGK